MKSTPFLGIPAEGGRAAKTDTDAPAPDAAADLEEGVGEDGRLRGKHGAPEAEALDNQASCSAKSTDNPAAAGAHFWPARPKQIKCSRDRRCLLSRSENKNSASDADRNWPKADPPARAASTQTPV